MSVYDELIKTDAEFLRFRKNRLELTNSVGNDLLAKIYERFVGTGNYNIPVSNRGPLYLFEHEGIKYEVVLIFIKKRASSLSDEYLDIAKFEGSLAYKDLYNAVNHLEGWLLNNSLEAFNSLNDVRQANNKRLKQLIKSDKRRFAYFYKDIKKTTGMGFFASRIDNIANHD